MDAVIIDGKKIAERILVKLNEKISSFKNKPGLAVVQVGNEPASTIYVNKKHKKCQELGIYSEVIRLPEDVSEDELLMVVEKLNKRKDIHGILVQLPLPKHIDENKVLDLILPVKDVDGFHKVNVGMLLQGREDLVAATPKGVIRLLEEYKIPIKGKHSVIIGRSNIVGKPCAVLLLNRDSTVTVCHSKTTNLGEITRIADILVCAIGRPKFIKDNMVKKGAAVIDVGTTKGADGKLFGDVDFDTVKKVAGYITPVPGGVGPMTIAMLMENVVYTFEKNFR